MKRHSEQLNVPVRKNSVNDAADANDESVITHNKLLICMHLCDRSREHPRSIRDKCSGMNRSIRSLSCINVGLTRQSPERHLAYITDTRKGMWRMKLIWVTLPNDAYNEDDHVTALANGALSFIPVVNDLCVSLKYSEIYQLLHLEFTLLTSDFFYIKTINDTIFDVIICLSLFANYRQQFLLDRFGRYLKVFVSTVITSSHAFASQFGLANFYRWKTQKKRAKNESLHECSVDRQRQVDNLNGDNCGHSGNILSETPSCRVKLRGKDHEEGQQDSGWTM